MNAMRFFIGTMKGGIIRDHAQILRIVERMEIFKGKILTMSDNTKLDTGRAKEYLNQFVKGDLIRDYDEQKLNHHTIYLSTP